MFEPQGGHRSRFSLTVMGFAVFVYQFIIYPDNGHQDVDGNEKQIEDVNAEPKLDNAYDAPLNQDTRHRDCKYLICIMSLTLYHLHFCYTLCAY